MLLVCLSLPEDVLSEVTDVDVSDGLMKRLAEEK